MKLTLTPDDLTPIICRHLETTMGLSMTDCSFAGQQEGIDIFDASKLVIEVEVQPKAATP